MCWCVAVERICCNPGYGNILWVDIIIDLAVRCQCCSLYKVVLCWTLYWTSDWM